MDVLVNKEYLNDLISCIERNIDFSSFLIDTYIHNDELAAALEEKFREIQYYLNRAYNPELAALKHLSNIYYQEWLSLKNKDLNAASAVLVKYTRLKCKIRELEIPF